MQVAPPDSIGVIDTMGCAFPDAYKYLVRKVGKLTGLPVEVHTHNDFGMAVATELAAVTAGAQVVHCCVNGLGERTGNAALEDLMVGLNLLLGMKSPYRFDRLCALSELVAERSGIRPAQNKPVVGKGNYIRESGIGVDLVMKQPLAMFATAPQLTGQTAKIVLGKKSGKASITYSLEQMGICDASDEVVTEILKEVKAKGTQKKGLLSPEEFQEIVKSVQG